MSMDGLLKYGILPWLLIFNVSCATFSPSYCTGSCTDADITTNIQTRLSCDKCLRYKNIHVSTYERVVTLQGEVENPTQKKIAGQIADSVPEVKYVINRIKIEPYTWDNS